MQNGTKAQMSIDFLIGMTLFASIFFIVFQFMGAAVSPFTGTGEEVSVKTQKVADGLQNEIQGERKGEIDLEYLKDNEDDIEQIMSDMGVDERRYGMNITVKDLDGNVHDGLQVGNRVPSGVNSATSRTTRYGYIPNEDKKVIIRVRMW